MIMTNNLKEINKTLKDCGIQIISYTREKSKTELESMIKIIKLAFCFNDKKGNESVVKIGKRLIVFIKKQDKMIKEHKRVIELIEDKSKTEEIIIEGMNEKGKKVKETINVKLRDVKIVKFNNNKFPKEDPLYNKCYRYSFINFEELINELGMIIPNKIINRAQVYEMLGKGEQIVTMNFTYFLKQGENK